MLPVEILPVPGGTLVLRARGSELLILPHHVTELKTRKTPKDFTGYFLGEALLNRPARKLFEAWLRKDESLWKRVYHTIQHDMEAGEENESKAESVKPVAKAIKPAKAAAAPEATPKPAKTAKAEVTAAPKTGKTEKIEVKKEKPTPKTAAPKAAAPVTKAKAPAKPDKKAVKAAPKAAAKDAKKSAAKPDAKKKDAGKAKKEGLILIKKYLVLGKNLFIQSKRPESVANEGRGFALEMPLEELWVIEELLKKSDYLLASGAPKPEVNALFQEVMMRCSKYAVHEKDRMWLSGRKRD